jgi:hypothetical protein
LSSLPTTTRRTVATTTSSSIVVLYNTVDNDTNNKVSTGTEGAFVPLSSDGVNEEGDDDDDDEDNDEDLLNKVEMFGKGAAKVCMHVYLHVCFVTVARMQKKLTPLIFDLIFEIISH